MTASAPAAGPATFRGVIALELRNGAQPARAALDAASAGDVVALLGRDLAALVPQVRDCNLALLAAHFDPAEALRPGWPLHRRALELLQRAPGQAQGPRMVGFGADAEGDVPMPLQAEAELAGDIKASWGDQMRSYVLQPYQMVKDLRTEHEVGNTGAVFDGAIDDFIEAGIRWRRSHSSDD